MKLALIASSALVAMSVAFAAGCTSDNSHDGNGTGPIAFSTESPDDGSSAGAHVYLRGRVATLMPNRLVFDVMARGAADVHGAAFRITFDPAALTFIEAKSGTPWSRDVLALAKEGSPGQLAIAWTEKGETGINATTETVIGTVTFDMQSATGSPVAFKRERSQLVDKRGVVVPAKWHSASITTR